MKTVIGIILIVVGVIALFSYPNFGKSGAETFGVIIGAGLITFLPGILLIRSDNKAKKN